MLNYIDRILIQFSHQIDMDLLFNRYSVLLAEYYMNIILNSNVRIEINEEKNSKTSFEGTNQSPLWVHMNFHQYILRGAAATRVKQIH